MSPAVQAAWDEALSLWGVHLQPPVVADEPEAPSFAWFSFPPRVHVDLAALARAGGGDHLASVLAHEVGHHVLSPSTRLTSLKLRHQLGRVLEAVDVVRSLEREPTVAVLSNLWSDLLINVRVARMQARRSPGEPDIVTLWRRLQARDVAGEPGRPPSPLTATAWWVGMRCYELLWSLPPGSLCRPSPPRQQVDRRPRGGDATAADRARALQDDLVASLDPVLDAEMLADTVRTFGGDPVAGALPFGMVLAPYLLQARASGLGAWREGRGGSPHACREADPAPPSAAEIASVLGDPRVHEPPRHPAAARLGGAANRGTPAGLSSGGQLHGIADTLALYPEALRDAVLAGWYQQAARPWVRPLHQPLPDVDGEEVPGPLEAWDPGDDPATIDWPATVRGGLPVVPGVSTRRRTWHTEPDRPRPASVDLDLYIDSSGSMPRPELGSAAVLAGTVVIDSVVRGGGRVRVTSFSGPGQVAGADEWSRDRVVLAARLCTYLGGGTTFPLDLLAHRYLERGAAADLRTTGTVRRHLLVISDDGLGSMFGVGQKSLAHVAPQVRRRLDTASLVLVGPPGRGSDTNDLARRAGYDVIGVPSIDDVPDVCARLAAAITRPEPARAGAGAGADRADRADRAVPAVQAGAERR